MDKIKFAGDQLRSLMQVMEINDVMLWDEINGLSYLAEELPEVDIIVPSDYNIIFSDNNGYLWMAKNTPPDPSVTGFLFPGAGHEAIEIHGVVPKMAKKRPPGMEDVPFDSNELEFVPDVIWITPYYRLRKWWDMKNMQEVV